MSLTSIFEIAGSGMSAQTTRLNTVASNLANAQTSASNVDDLYRGRHPVFKTILDDAREGVFAGVGGVRVAGIIESQAPPTMRYQPGHPDANEDDYVMYPNVNVIEQMTDMMSTSRSFQLNVEVMNTTKTMLQRVLSLGQ